MTEVARVCTCKLVPSTASTGNNNNNNKGEDMQDEMMDDVYDDEPCRACASNNHGIAEPHEGGWRCMCCRIPLTVMLTDAPVAYDYGAYDTDLGDVAVTYVPLRWFKGKVRSVAVPSGDKARYQFDRYLSGSYTVTTVWPVNV